jgi:hypothetical protein
VLAVEAQAQIERAMASCGFCAASAGLLATSPAHLDEVSADEPGLFEQKSQFRVLRSVALGQSGSREHWVSFALIYY